MITITILFIIFIALAVIIITVFGSLTMIVYTIIAVPVAFIKALVVNVKEFYGMRRKYKKEKRKYEMMIKETENTLNDKRNEL